MQEAWGFSGVGGGRGIFWLGQRIRSVSCWCVCATLALCARPGRVVATGGVVFVFVSRGDPAAVLGWLVDPWRRTMKCAVPWLGCLCTPTQRATPPPPHPHPPPAPIAEITLSGQPATEKLVEFLVKRMKASEHNVKEKALLVVKVG